MMMSLLRHNNIVTFT